MDALGHIHRLSTQSDERHYDPHMPRQNTRPAAFPPFILQQIEQLAGHIVAARKASGETQAQWAHKLGISQPTMARIERGDPAIATATYVMCLWLVNPQLNLLELLPNNKPAMAIAPAFQVEPPSSATPVPTSAADEFALLLAKWPMPAL